MMKINTSCYNRLRNDEFLGLHQNIVELTASITGEEIRRKIFIENADPFYLNQDQSTGVITNIVNSLKAIGDVKLDAFNLVATLAIGKATLESDEGCTQFIKAVNSHIELKKAHLKLRKGKGKITVTPETPETAVIEIPTETKDEENAA